MPPTSPKPWYGKCYFCHHGLKRTSSPAFAGFHHSVQLPSPKDLVVFLLAQGFLFPPKMPLQKFRLRGIIGKVALMKSSEINHPSILWSSDPYNVSLLPVINRIITSLIGVMNKPSYQFIFDHLFIGCNFCISPFIFRVFLRGLTLFFVSLPPKTRFVPKNARINMKLLRENKNKATFCPNKVGPGSRTAPLDPLDGKLRGGSSGLKWFFWREKFHSFFVQRFGWWCFFHICRLKIAWLHWKSCYLFPWNRRIDITNMISPNIFGSRRYIFRRQPSPSWLSNDPTGDISF